MPREKRFIKPGFKWQILERSSEDPQGITGLLKTAAGPPRPAGTQHSLSSPAPPPAVDGKLGDHLGQQMPLTWRPCICQWLLCKGQWLIAHCYFGPRSNNTDDVTSWIQMAEKCRRKMMLAGINAQPANSYRVAVILCIILQDSSLSCFYFTKLLSLLLWFFLLFLKLYFFLRDMSQIIYIQNWVHSWYRKAHKFAEPQPQLMGAFPRQVWVSTTDTSTAFNSFHSLDFSSPRHPHPDTSQNYLAACVSSNAPAGPSRIPTDATHAHKITAMKCQAVTQTSRYFKHFEQIEAKTKTVMKSQG